MREREETEKEGEEGKIMKEGDNNTNLTQKEISSPTVNL